MSQDLHLAWLLCKDFFADNVTALGSDRHQADGIRSIQTHTLPRLTGCMCRHMACSSWPCQAVALLDLSAWRWHLSRVAAVDSIPN